MQAGRSVLAQLMDFILKPEFDKCVQRYGGDKRVRHLSCYGQFLAMRFAQLTGRESLRDIETCLRAVGRKLYYAGLRSPAPRSTMAIANERRDWRIFADFAQFLIAQATRLYAGEPLGVELKGAAYALDSTTVDLCLGLFPWAKYKQTRGGVKMHTLRALRGNFPNLVVITPAHVHDVNVLAELAFEPGALYVMDRVYMDFAQFHRINQVPAFFLTNAKRNLKFRRRTSAPADKNAGVRFDQTGVLAKPTLRRRYPDTLRRVGYRDPDTGKPLVFLTNNAFLSALDVAQLYRRRWQIELFFRWIKQHLRIKAFYGTSPNAVKTQIWIAICTYVLVTIARKRLGLSSSLYTILQIMSVTLFERPPISQALSLAPRADSQPDLDNQLCLQGSNRTAPTPPIFPCPIILKFILQLPKSKRTVIEYVYARCGG